MTHRGGMPATGCYICDVSDEYNKICVERYHRDWLLVKFNIYIYIYNNICI